MESFILEEKGNNQGNTSSWFNNAAKSYWNDLWMQENSSKNVYPMCNCQWLGYSCDILPSITVHAFRVH